MKIVTVRLQGGLGNQMFQIATTYAYAQKFNFIPKFDFASTFTFRADHYYSYNNGCRFMEDLVMLKTVIVAYVGLLIFSEAKADYQAPLKQEIKTTFCKNIEGQTTMLMNTYNSNENSVDGGNEEVRNEIVRIRSIGLTNLNFMANIWVAFCNK